MSKLRNIANYVHRNGINFTIRELYLRLNDRFYENYFGVRTDTRPQDSNDGKKDKEAGEYGTIHYKNLFFLFNQQFDHRNESILLDYGCGKGRVITAAAFSHFRKIIGIEFSPLINIAQDNLKKMKHRKTINIEIIAEDARRYSIPPEVNLIYFYNPFTGSILQTVIENIQLSYKNHPRKIKIIYVNNDHFDQYIQGQTWLKKKMHGMLFPDNSYGLYETI